MINNHNYQEYLLLYIDGELTPAEQQAVELFIAQNKEVAAELSLLQSSKLAADNMVFAEKNNLYKNVHDGVNTQNYTEKFLLYADNELSTNAKKEVEQFVLQNPTYQTQFLQIKQTILPSEHIVCPNKEALYKKEKTPVILLFTKRIAVAAIFLLLAVGLWQLNNTSTITKPNTFTQSTANKNNLNTTVTKSNPQPYNTTTTSTTKILTSKISVINQRMHHTTTEAKDNITNTVATAANNNYTAASNNSTNNIATTIVANNTNTVNAETVSVRPEKTINNIPALTNTTTTQQVIYKYVDVDNIENYSTNTVTANEGKVLIGGIQVEKNKLNQLFHKAKKLLGKEKQDNNTYASNTSVTL
jgi:hypothetical protein